MMLASCELFLNEPNDNSGRIILIGVGIGYTGSNLSLSGTLNDVKMLSSAFQDLSSKEKKPFYWIPLTDEAIFGSPNYATEENIKNSINYLVKNSSATKPLIIENPKSFDLDSDFADYINSDKVMNNQIELNSNDILVFQYSGHGSYNSGALNLISDENQNRINVFDLDDVYNLFSSLPCKSLLLIDSCYSGNAIPISDTTISTNDPRVDKRWFGDYFNFLFETKTSSNSSFIKNKNIFILTATTSNKESKESKQGLKYVGAFTNALLLSLGWNIQPYNSSSIGISNETIPSLNKGKITLDNIYEYMNKISHNNSDYDARIIGDRYDLVLFDY